MKIIEIKSKKQDNGIWGMPLNCIKLDMKNFFLYDDKKTLLSSALIIAINEKFDRRFEVWFNDDYLTITVFGIGSFPAGRLYAVHFKNYEIIDNYLYEFDNDKEKMIFLRKQKMNKLKLC